MKKETKYEDVGYAFILKILRGIIIFFSKIVGYFKKWEEKIRFQKFKLAFGERDDDIYISTYPKSGTTLTQVILYCLTTDSNMKFNHIYDVSPWIRNASFLRKQPVDLPSPRIIKTHDEYKDFNKNLKGKIIYVYRDGMDVAVSQFNQQKNYNAPNLEFDSFLRNFLKSKKWFKHVELWMKNKKHLPILYIRYEDLLRDKRKEINKIIEFCGIKCSEAAIKKAIKYSDFKYMKANETKFGDQPTEKNKIFNQFIRKGKSGEGKQKFSDSQVKEFTQLYNENLKETFDKIF
ncbi:MAG: hypothetical protein CMP67_00470 [Flavobacteriales bacterium]|nr:hypothetical protein [Flavobacteriales bacterium]|tara:strand:- start:65286 stop:66155 length:870 start_codon:yes stop_codon:yes gene_type:complete